MKLKSYLTAFAVTPQIIYIGSKFQVFIDNSGTGFSIVFEPVIGRGQTGNLYPWQRIRK